MNLRYESAQQTPVRGSRFVWRLFLHGMVAVLFIATSLGGGVLGYHHWGGLGWRRAFLNAAMILGGMGPVDPIPNGAAEVFAGSYALYSGVAFIAAAGLMLAPVLHRIMHELQWDEDT